MTASTTSRLENSVRETAIRRLGTADASVRRVHERTPPPREGFACSGTTWAGDWYGLFVLLGGEWQMIGRRRTMAELLELAETVELCGRRPSVPPSGRRCTSLPPAGADAECVHTATSSAGGGSAREANSGPYFR